MTVSAICDRLCKTLRASTKPLRHDQWLARVSTLGSLRPGTVDKALDKVAEIAPEIKTDREHAMAFKLPTAISSQGQDVFPNFETGYKIYRYWREHGQFPTTATNKEFTDLYGEGSKADKQALLWYVEQHLFQMGGAPSTSYDYLDAAHTLVRKVKTGQI